MLLILDQRREQESESRHPEAERLRYYKGSGSQARSACLRLITDEPVDCYGLASSKYTEYSSTISIIVRNNLKLLKGKSDVARVSEREKKLPEWRIGGVLYLHTQLWRVSRAVFLVDILWDMASSRRVRD